MKFVVATYGTEGDARPFAALCRGLMDAGHEARLLADVATLGSAKALGVPTASLAGDIRGILGRDPAIAHAVGKGGGFNQTTRALTKIAGENAESWLRSIVEAAEGCDAILAAGLAAFIGFSAAECLGVKAIGAGMIPITPTAAFPSPMLASSWVPSRFNRVSHRLVNAVLWNLFRAKTNAARAKFKLPPRRSVWNGIPMVYGVSSRLLPKPADWAANVHLCGQWLATSPGWRPPSALVNFLASGEPPIYVGFGSMTGFVHAPLMEALSNAMANRRVLFHRGWSGIDPKALPSNFLAIDDTPHEWLFPRIAAAIHHGGSGTSHSAARAGVPSIVVPFAGDQFFWAERLRLAGASPAAVNGRRPKTEALARALEVAASVQVRNRARALGETMRAENGVLAAVTALERIATS
ncbi:MAG: glycosyltransferase [Candidatus Methylacidiphilaceae bacterium]